MKKGVWIYLALLIALQFTKIIAINGITEDYGEGRIEIYVDESERVNFEVFALGEGYKGLQPTVTSSRRCWIKGKEKVEVLGIAVNEHFLQTHPIKMKNGAFFGECAVKEGRNVSIISDELSRKLFGSDKAVGNLYTIEDTTYQVVGVYKKYRDFWDYLFDDGQERIYYPITSKIAEDGKIETLSISLKNRKDEITMHELSDEMQMDNNNSYIDNELDAGKKLRSFAQAPLNLIYLFIVVYLIKRVIRLIKSKEESMKKKAIKVGLCIISGALMVRVMVVPLYIPQEALPPYNIFDIGFYIKYLRSQRIIHNYLLQLHLSNFNRIYIYVRNIILIAGILQVAIFFRIKGLLPKRGEKIK